MFRFYAALALSLTLGTPVIAEASTGNVNLSLGWSLRDSPSPDQPGTALDLTIGGEGWAVVPNVYVSATRKTTRTDTMGDITTETNAEAGLGVSRIWRVGSLRPHLGGGFSRLWRTYDYEPEYLFSRIEESSDTAMWLSTGMFWSVGHVNLGGLVRLSGIGEAGSSLGGTHLGFTLGWGW